MKIEGIGEVLLGASVGEHSLDEIKSIIREMVLDVAGEETAYIKCVRAYHEYLKDPSDFNREVLRKAYEAVPESERIYLEDMDSDRGILCYLDKKKEV